MFKIDKKLFDGRYWRCQTTPAHPNVQKYNWAVLHRVVVENHLGRLLDKDEHVHHIDENVNNNDISNLRVMSPSEHKKFHWDQTPRLYITDYCPCGKSMTFIAGEWRRRLKYSKCKKLFCSLPCAGYYAHPSNQRIA